MSWTDERVELLKKLWGEGLSATQIARRMGGVTRNAVIGKVHRLGLSGRATPTRNARLRPRRTRSPSLPLITSGVSGEEQSPQNGAKNIFRSALDDDVASAKSAIPTNYGIRGHGQRLDPMPEPDPAPIQEIKIPFGERRTILTITEHTCKWPIGDPGSDAFHFCGRKPQTTFPYCPHHARIAYQPIQDRRRQKRSRAHATENA